MPKASKIERKIKEAKAKQLGGNSQTSLTDLLLKNASTPDQSQVNEAFAAAFSTAPTKNALSDFEKEKHQILQQLSSKLVKKQKKDAKPVKGGKKAKEEQEEEQEDEESKQENEEVVETEEKTEQEDTEEAMDELKAELDKEEKVETENQKNDPDRIKRTIFVGNVPVVLTSETTETSENSEAKLNKIKKQLTKRFQQYGKIDAIRFRSLPVEEKGTHINKKLNTLKKSFIVAENVAMNAFIVFNEEDSVMKAVEGENGKEFFGRSLRVDKALPSGEHKRLLENTIYVTNLPFDATEDDIRKFFENAGPIATINLLKHSPTTSKGIAFVQFADRVGYQNSFEFDQTAFQGRTITIAKSRKMNKKRAMSEGAPKPRSGAERRISKKLGPQIATTNQDTGKLRQPLKRKKKVSNSQQEKKRIAEILTKKGNTPYKPNANKRKEGAQKSPKQKDNQKKKKIKTK